MAEPHPTEEIVKTQVEARQGVTGHNVRIVLFSGLTLAILAGVILYLTVAVPTGG